MRNAIAAFWGRARAAHPELPAYPPAAWEFGATAAQADELLELVLTGIKTATAGSLRDHEHDNEPVPQPGDLSIIVDGAGRPRAVIGLFTIGRVVGV
ncbi:MAG: ASCH domain-containing protein [Promicromonosporaceae bacterium]|nr:ASCH domain-containing protein [Promicromonosporaceae bacterium]